MTPDPIDQARVDDLKNLGATSTELRTHADKLEELQLVRTIWPGERKYTMADVARRLNADVGDIIEIRVSSGFAEPDPSTPVATDADLDFYRSILDARELFGEQELLQLLRVIGASVAKIADATVSAFLVHIDPQTRQPLRHPAQGPASHHPASDQGAPNAPGDATAPLGTASALDSASDPTISVISELLPELSTVVDTLLRKHLVAARRTSLTETVGAYEIRQLAIGFADLIGSTELAERLPFARIGQLLATFEEATSSIITRHGGRVVKLIGDEVLFAAADPSQAAKIGFAIAEVIATIDHLPGVRVGIAAGEVLTRDGDVFGPPVNRAARIVKHAAPGTVLVTPVVREHAARDFSFELTGAVDLPGFSTPTELWRLRDPRRDVSADRAGEDIE